MRKVKVGAGWTSSALGVSPQLQTASPMSVCSPGPDRWVKSWQIIAFGTEAIVRSEPSRAHRLGDGGQAQASPNRDRDSGQEKGGIPTGNCPLGFP